MFGKNVIKPIFTVAVMLLTLALSAADRIAIAEPVIRGRVNADEVAGIWDIMESSFQSDEYELVSRSALTSMLTEIGITKTFDLLSLNIKQKSAIRLKGLKFILVPTVAKVGSQYNLLIKVVNASTGEVDQRRSANLRTSTIDEMADRIEATLLKALSDKQTSVAAVLNPVIRCKVPENFTENLTSGLEETLLINGVTLQNLSSVDRIFKENKLNPMSELEPKMYVKVGKLLEVDYLIYNVITRFDVTTTERYIKASNRTVRTTQGKIAGTIYVISAKNGQKAAVIPMDTVIDFRRIGEDTTGWTDEDYYRFMTFNCISPKAIAAILKLPGISGVAADRHL